MELKKSLHIKPNYKTGIVRQSTKLSKKEKASVFHQRQHGVSAFSIYSDRVSLGDGNSASRQPFQGGFPACHLTNFRTVTTNQKALKHPSKSNKLKVKEINLRVISKRQFEDQRKQE